MRRVIVYFILFSIAIFTLIYFYTSLSVNQQRTIEVLQDITEQAADTDDFEAFVRYQSIAHRVIDIIKSESHSVHLYEVIAQENDIYRHRIVAFVVWRGDFQYAMDIDDPDDRTQMIYQDQSTDVTIFDSKTDEDYANRAISYGIDRIGFYYYMFFIDADQEATFMFYDYEGHLFFATTPSYQYEAYDASDDRWIPAYTVEERDELMDINTFIRPVLTRNVGIFLAVDFMIGGGLFFYSKKKKIYMNKKGVNNL